MLFHQYKMHVQWCITKWGGCCMCRVSLYLWGVLVWQVYHPASCPVQDSYRRCLQFAVKVRPSHICYQYQAYVVQFQSCRCLQCHQLCLKEVSCSSQPWSTQCLLTLGFLLSSRQPSLLIQLSLVCHWSLVPYLHSIILTNNTIHTVSSYR